MSKQQIIGVINISLPIIILYQLYPPILLSWVGPILCSGLVGLYICYINKMSNKNLLVSLRYKASENYKNMFGNLLSECGINPESISIYYAYTREQIAIAVNNSIIVDPLLWSLIEDDASAIEAKDILKKFVEPTFSEKQKNRITLTRQIFSTEAQNFIFKHEVGHIVSNFSNKKLIYLFFMGFVASYVGIVSAMNMVAYNGIGSILMGMIIGGTTDIILTWIFNLLIKFREEKWADEFAVNHSTAQEIEAAALFFEKHQELINNDKEGLINFPSVIISGHADGLRRAKHLRATSKIKLKVANQALN